MALGLGRQLPPGLAGGKTVVEARGCRPANTLGYIGGGVKAEPRPEPLRDHLAFRVQGLAFNFQPISGCGDLFSWGVCGGGSSWGVGVWRSWGCRHLVAYRGEDELRRGGHRLDQVQRDQHPQPSTLNPPP